MRLKISVELEGEADLTRQLTEEETAALLNVPRNLLCMMRLEGKGPRVWRIEGKASPRYRLLDVLRFAQKHVRFSFREPATTRHYAAPRGSRNPSRSAE